MTSTPSNPLQPKTQSLTSQTTARARSAAADDPAALSGVIEKNRSIINRGWEELARLTRMLDALDAREASIIEHDLKNPPARSIPSEAPAL